MNFEEFRKAVVGEVVGEGRDDIFAHGVKSHAGGERVVDVVGEEDLILLDEIEDFFDA